LLNSEPMNGQAYWLQCETGFRVSGEREEQVNVDSVMMIRYFTLEYWEDEGWYVGRLKEAPGVFSQGASLQELEENIREAYQLMMEEKQIS